MKIKLMVMKVMVIIMILTGCSTPKEVGETGIDDNEINENTSHESVIDANTPMGRYTETNITPAEIDNASNIHFSKDGKGKFLLTVYDHDKKEPRGFIYEGNTWTEQNNSNVIEFSKENLYKEVDVVSDFAGNWWLFLKEEEKFDKGVKIGPDGSKLEFEAIEEEYINDVIVSNENLYFECTTDGEGSKYIIDIELEKVVDHKIPESFQYGFYVEGNKVHTESGNNGYKCYDATTGEVMEHYELPSYGDRFRWDVMDIDGEEFIFLNDEGIHKREKEGKIIQTIVSDLGYAYRDQNKDSYYSNFKADSKGDRYFLVDTFNQGELKVLEYKFDETVPSHKNETVSIWALENSNIKEKIAIFSQQYPDVQVELISDEIVIPVVLDTNEELEKAYNIYYDEKIKKLNSQLLAGEAPDIICLDGLSIDALQNKDMLSIINLDIEESEYYEHILNSYSSEEGAYAYPTGFTTFLLAGDGSIDLDKENTMDNLKKIDSGSFDTYFYPNYHKIFPDYQTVNEEELKKFVLSIKEMRENYDPTYFENKSFSEGTLSHYVNKIQCMENTWHFFLSHKNVEIVPLLDGTYRNQNILAIPKDAKNKEMAQNFIEVSLDKGLGYRGMGVFSLKRGVEIEMLKKEYPADEEPMITPESEGTYVLNKNRNADMHAVDWESIIESLEYGCEEDYVLDKIVENGVMEYCESTTLSIDEAMANIMNKLDLLFAERS